MLSRVAENIYWMSRYMERTNISLRSLKTFFIAHQDGFPVLSWAEIGNQFGIADTQGMSSYDVLYTLIFDANADFSLLNNVFRARENARSAQDHITKELWQSLNDFYHLVRDEQFRVQLYIDPIYVFDQLIKQAMLYYGVIDNSMNRGEAFIFLHMGKSIERGLQIVEALKRQLEFSKKKKTKAEDQSWRYLLFSLNAYETYITENVGVFDPKLVVDLIVYKYNFPNSIFYSWKEIESYANLMATEGINLHNRDLSFIIGKSYSFVRYTELPGTAEEQLQFLCEVESGYLSLARVLNKEYFGIIN